MTYAPTRSKSHLVGLSVTDPTSGKPSTCATPRPADRPPAAVAVAAGDAVAAASRQSSHCAQRAASRSRSTPFYAGQPGLELFGRGHDGAYVRVRASGT